MAMKILTRIALAGALLTAATDFGNAADTAKKLYFGVGNTSAEYWTQLIWGAQQVMNSVGGKLEVISNDFDPQKSLQNISTIVAPGCEGCMFTWFPDSSAFTKVFVERVAQSDGFITTLWNRPEGIHPWDTASNA
jgi:ribose transport system substrate-binding protein